MNRYLRDIPHLPPCFPPYQGNSYITPITICKCVNAFLLENYWFENVRGWNIHCPPKYNVPILISFILKMLSLFLYWIYLPPASSQCLIILLSDRSKGSLPSEIFFMLILIIHNSISWIFMLLKLIWVFITFLLLLFLHLINTGMLSCNARHISYCFILVSAPVWPLEYYW